MTRPERTMADGRADRSFHDLLGICRDQLDLIEATYRWRAAQLDGRQDIDDSIPIDSGGHGPGEQLTGTELAAVRRSHIAKKVGRAKGKLAGVVDRLEEIAEVLHLDAHDPRYSEQARESDDNDSDRRRHLGPARVDGGVSAYRNPPGRDTERRKVPRGRPDITEAYDAQRRRLDRGEGYGDA